MKGPDRVWTLTPPLGGAPIRIKRWTHLKKGETFQEATSRTGPYMTFLLNQNEDVARDIYADLLGAASPADAPQLDGNAWRSLRQAFEQGVYVITAGPTTGPDAYDDKPTTGDKYHKDDPLERVVHNFPFSVAEMMALIRSKWPEIGDAGAITMAAQWAHETKYGDSCWNYNMGNFKAPGVGVKHTYFKETWEVVSAAAVPQILVANGRLARAPTEEECHKRGWGHQAGQAVVVFNPPHIATCFRAFDTLPEGVDFWVSQLKLYASQHAELLAALIEGDVKTFAHVLKLVHYYTGSEPEYVRGMREAKALYDSQLGPKK